MNTVKKCGGILFFVLILNACIEPYDPPLKESDANLLVVDAFMDVSNGAVNVKLSRSLPVKNFSDFPRESGAFVRIEDGGGNTYTIAEWGGGTYTGNVPDPGVDQTYRLLITTADNQEYASGFIQIVETPSIDSVTWTADRDGIEFAVTTHDPTHRAKHFRWKYEETYEYNATFNSLFKWVGTNVVPRELDESVFTCWRTIESTDIIVGSARLLNEAVISKFPITVVPLESVKLSIKYSLLVKQQALTEEAYDYWTSLERSTENLGGLFDPLPSEVQGNIRSISDPNQTVLGFFSSGQTRETRIFFTRNQIPRELRPGYRPNSACRLDTVFLADIPKLNGQGLVVDPIYAMGAGLIGYTHTSASSCADCTKFGGTTTRPTFWK